MTVPKNIFVTGRPGIGKTTCVMKVAEGVRARGFVVGGMISAEERRGGRRTGFKIVDLLSGREGYLAKAGVAGGPRIGRYKVILDDLEKIGVAAILRAVEEGDLIVIDEIGPMELLSERFRDTVLRALDSRKPVLGTVHYRARSRPFGRRVLGREDVRVYYLTEENRGRAPDLIVKDLLRILPKSS